ncbi:uncharacterized protein LOC135367068 [Ornithodoros turicata]|uniref:uncharacterized protein LOC135367068 n=1 Tax=Ornithodoros turicata TaxID=34597 RepID=UPI003138CB56
MGESSKFSVAKLIDGNYQVWKFKCFGGPFVKWYNNFRNFRDDTLFGNEPCFALTQIGPYDTCTRRLTAQENSLQNGSLVTSILPVELVSTEGYPTPNAFHLFPDCPGKSVIDPVVYIDCAKCVIVRTPEGNGNGCRFYTINPFVVDPCCEFVYHLVCGPEKYHYYDPERCPRY